MPGQLLARRIATVAAVLGALCGLFGGARVATAQQVAIEYYYAAWNFYFVTSLTSEIEFIEGGGYGGAWKRTGQTFLV